MRKYDIRGTVSPHVGYEDYEPRVGSPMRLATDGNVFKGTITAVTPVMTADDALVEIEEVIRREKIYGNVHVVNEVDHYILAWRKSQETKPSGGECTQGCPS